MLLNSASKQVKENASQKKLIGRKYQEVKVNIETPCLARGHL